MGCQAIGPVGAVVKVCESVRAKHRQQAGMRGLAFRDMEIFQGGKRGYLLHEERREIDVAASQRSSVEKQRKRVEK
jgi:hypothetical protein